MEQPGNLFNNLASLAADAAQRIDIDGIAEGAAAAGQAIGAKADEFKDAAVAAKNDIADKMTELDRMLDQATTDYNDAFTQMNDCGIQLFIARTRAQDAIGLAKRIIDSIASHPKSFDTSFEEVEQHRKSFADTCSFADRELHDARAAATQAGAGLAAGTALAFMAPTGAMWIATAFGTASTGVAISTLSGAAAESAALAWLGGGALAAGGSGIAGGTALLALAGPIGWTAAGLTVCSSIVIFARNRQKLAKQKSEEIEALKRNTEAVRESEAEIASILAATAECRDGLEACCASCLPYFGRNYNELDVQAKMELGSLVNSTLALSELFTKKVAQKEQPDA